MYPLQRKEVLVLYATTVGDAIKKAQKIGFPLEVRSQYSLGGNPKIANNLTELEEIAREGIELSPISEISLDSVK